MLSHSTAGYDALCEATEPSPSFTPDRDVSPSGLVLGLGRDEGVDAVVCDHPLVEVLSVNGRNLDGAARQCACCGERVAERKAISDQQIRDLRAEPNTTLAADKHVALFGSGGARNEARQRCAEATVSRERRIPADPRLAAIADQLAESILATLEAHGLTLVGPADSDVTHADFAREAARNAVGIAAMEGVL